MIVYLFDENTGEFLHEYSPQINPKNPNEYLYPKNSTLIKPFVKKGSVPVFDGSVWVQTPDYRGQEMINPVTKDVEEVKEIGEIPEDYVLYSNYRLTEDYQNWQKFLLLEEKKREIFYQIDEIDKKRIRAICEPETREDGISWLEYYTTQIVELRKKLQEL